MSSSSGLLRRRPVGGRETRGKGHNKQATASGKATDPRSAEAEQSPPGRMRRSMDLASSLIKEAQMLARDKTFAAEWRCCKACASVTGSISTAG